MKKEGTYVLGIYFEPEQIEEILNNPKYKKTFVRSILEFRTALSALKKELEQTRTFRKIEKLLENINNFLIGKGERK